MERKIWVESGEENGKFRVRRIERLCGRRTKAAEEIVVCLRRLRKHHGDDRAILVQIRNWMRQHSLQHQASPLVCSLPDTLEFCIPLHPFSFVFFLLCHLVLCPINILTGM